MTPEIEFHAFNEPLFIHLTQITLIFLQMKSAGLHAW